MGDPHADARAREATIGRRDSPGRGRGGGRSAAAGEQRRDQHRSPAHGRSSEADGEQAAAPEGGESRCWLCERPLGTRIEWHHPRPKSRGGRVTVPVHPICHRALHAAFSNVDLARLDAEGERPAGREEMKGFLAWIAGKPPDFHAPTRRRKG